MNTKKIFSSVNLAQKSATCAPCEDRTHDLQIATLDYETDALPTALTRHW